MQHLLDYNVRDKDSKYHPVTLQQRNKGKESLQVVPVFKFNLTK